MNLNDHVGFNLRKAYQRHVSIFSRNIVGLTPTQFAALTRIDEEGEISQNRLGRETAMDSATIKGVVERLHAKGLVHFQPAEHDQRLRMVSLTPAGQTTLSYASEQAKTARQETLAPLTPEETRQFERLLSKLV